MNPNKDFKGNDYMKRLLSVLICFVLIISFASSASAQITKDQYYARSTLSGNELEFYDYVYDRFASGHSTVYPEDYGISDDRAREIGAYVFGDAPELYNYNGIYSDEEKAKLDEQLAEKAAEILSLVTDDMAEYEKFEVIGEYLVENVIYDMSSDTGGQDIVDGLLNGKAVCAGISESLQYLLYQMDIPSYGVITDYGSMYHRVNLIQINGEWYYFDITSYMKHVFDEQITVQPYRKLLLKDDTFKLTHTIDPSRNPPLPACTSDKYMTEPTPEPTETPTIEPTPQATISPQATHEAQPTNSRTPILPILIIISAAVIALTIIIKIKKGRSYRP